ncbi:hypothetical protein YA0783_26930 [Pseudomonas corrugata]|uniref:hypothetical protein n=1 Tax=Pseudomonas corrugata TaxID=47879 RepID=UPI0018E5D48D|nr:hypothetical protein [Pseudomonas corrugata]MBI6621927.1 hypothetical protein [Pseudomonas corrugata]MBI6692336.1 hypothetical protein [Pseudomonas corrugata]
MSKAKTETERPTADAVLREPAQSEPSTIIGPARVFRDTRYTSRTLIMPKGQPVPVIAGLVTACGDEQYAFLEAHPDLQPLTE